MSKEAPGTFVITARDETSRARTGVLWTAHGPVETPVFMPVGTQATVKALEPRDLRENGATIILSNTYHLMLRPGADVVANAGVLHAFMNWNGPILTDSGGFQVFSLAKLRKLTPEGCSFNSHLDGREVFLGPKESMEVQRLLGSDIAMVFDECLPWPCDRARAEKSVAQTLDWAKMSQDAPHAPGQLVFGIVQGGIYDDIRRHCAEELSSMDFPGYAIGGVSVGEPEEAMYQAVEASVPYLRAGRGHVRLRAAHAHRAPRHCAHAPRQRCDKGGEVGARPRAGGGGVRLLLLPELHAQLRAPPAARRRDTGRAPSYHPQRAPPARVHARAARIDSGRYLRRLPRSTSQRPTTKGNNMNALFFANSPAPAPKAAAPAAAPAAPAVTAAPTTQATEVQPADADAAATPPAQQGGGFGMFLPMLLIFAIFYFMMIKPQQRKEKERRKMIEELRAGAKVIFAGGFIGTIVEAKEKTFKIEIAGDVVVEVARAAVQGLAAEEAPAAK